MTLNRKWQKWIRMITTAFLMSMVMSFGMCLVRIGFKPEFIPAWLQSWPVGFLIAIPAAMMAPKIIEPILNHIEFK
ncbi:DUF2798 domain-containing protein [Pasteurellaceae bacterium LIM206]|nr:DUF2798 domain-containing protein [Pasteurellaceae bacterium LIM206]